MKLYELTGNIKELESMVESGDVPADQVRDTLELLEGDFNDKAKNIVMVIKNTNTEAIDAEIKRLQSMKKTIVNKKESLKDYLRENMQASGISKIESDIIKVTLKKPTKKLVITDEDLIPDEYISVETSLKVDAKALTAAIKEGATLIEGAHLEDSKAPIEIK